MPITMLARNETIATHGVKIDHVTKAMNLSESLSSEDYSLITTYTGRVIALREINGAYDSDFIATVWSYDDRPIEIEYATTRGWTYANSAEVDATPEILKKYKRHSRAQDIRDRLNRRQRDAEVRAKARLTFAEHKRLKRAYWEGGDNYKSVLKLLQTRRFRSTFRQSIATQVREWASIKAPEFSTPLSVKQLAYIF